MIVLTEKIDIPAAYEKLEAWAANFEEEFVKWSPCHSECNLYDGNYYTGSKVRFREIVMGLDYDVVGTITECEQDKDHFRIVFQSDKKTAFITFEGERTAEGCRFSHTEFFGMTTPVIGTIMNFLIFKVLFRKKAKGQLIRDDMILDNGYLTELLTMGKYPPNGLSENVGNRQITDRNELFDQTVKWPQKGGFSKTARLAYSNQR